MKYVASWSGGKDSTASVILARINGDPIDEIVYSEVMFSETISGEVPEHIRFIHEVAIPKFEEWGYKVTVLRGEKTYLDCFNHVLVRGKNEGMKRGFPYFGGCCINRDCKMPPITKYWKEQGADVIQYVGIATDEPKRLERLKGTNRVSLLEKYGYTERQAEELCERYGLLSPVYQFAKRNGCWFCPNAAPAELRHLYFNHPDLVDELRKLERTPGLQPRGSQFNRTGTPTQAFEPYYWESQQMTIDDFLTTKG